LTNSTKYDIIKIPKRKGNKKMKNATEFNALANAGIVDKENKELNEALRYTDNILAGNFEAAARRGKKSVWVTKPKNIKWKYIRAYLKQNGFITFEVGMYCLVKW
jgi:hypothetical protein